MMEKWINKSYFQQIINSVFQLQQSIKKIQNIVYKINIIDVYIYNLFHNFL